MVDKSSSSASTQGVANEQRLGKRARIPKYLVPVGLYSGTGEQDRAESQHDQQEVPGA